MPSTLKLPVVHCEYCGQPVIWAEAEGSGDPIPIEVDPDGEPIVMTPRARVGRVQIHRAIVPLAEDLGRTTLEVYPLRPAGEVQPDLDVWLDHRANCPR